MRKVTEARDRMAHGHQALSHRLKLLFRLLGLGVGVVSVLQVGGCGSCFGADSETQLCSFWDFLPVSLALWLQIAGAVPSFRIF